MSDIFILDNESKKNWQSQITKESEEGSFMDSFNSYLLSKQSLQVKEKVIFFRLLATMLNSWISLTKSLSILEKQEKKETVLKNIITKSISDIKSWKWLSECLANYPSSFSNAEVWMIESWEKTWRLNTALLDLSAQVEKIASMNWKLKSAMMYPAMILVVLTWVIIVLMVMVVPKLLEIVWNKESLPASTQLLMWVSDFFVWYWWLIAIIWFALVSFVKLWWETQDWRYYLDKLTLKLPIFWEINKKIVLSKFSRVLSLMLKSWVSIVESLRITSEAVWNEVYRQRILLLRDDIKRWLKIYESLEDDPLFPDMMVSMIQVWEQSSKIDEIIIKVASFYDEEVDNTIWVINKLLEPIILVTMAVVVWFIAVAIMQPIMNLSNTISWS